MRLSAILILAGGQSSRMGKPKALLPLPTGQTLLDFHLSHAKLLGVPILLADNGKNFGQGRDACVVSDYLPNDTDGKGAGALSALCGAMMSVADGYVLTVSCDSLISANQLWAYLQNHINTNQIKADVVYLKNAKDYPLLGLYHTRLLNELRDYLDAGERSVMKFLANLHVVTADVPHNWQHLLNFNTQDEFTLALTAFKQTMR